MSQQHEYTDYQTHFEDCPHCRRDRPCPVAAAIQQREAKEKKR